MPVVRARILDMLRAQAAEAIVCSAACGADLLALDAAGELHLRRRVVLPFQPQKFREKSVVDRPGVWGKLYDDILLAAERAGDLLVMTVNTDTETDESYAAANETILDDALALATGVKPPRPVITVVVWDGKPRKDRNDLSARFRASAVARGLTVLDVSTLP